MWLSAKQRRRIRGAETMTSGTPLPTRIVSNGEYMPIAQTRAQQEVEARLVAMADETGARMGMDRRAFLRSSAGMAAAFLAFNQVFGDVFAVSPVEAADLGAAGERARSLAGQYIVDMQLHFLRDDFGWDGILALGEYAKQWNPDLVGEEITFKRFQIDNFIKEVYFDSDTKIGLLSAGPAEQAENVTLGNDGMADARRTINTAAGSRRLLTHSVIAPGKPGWMDEIERAIAEIKPDSWKGYTVGDPFGHSEFAYRLDDEALMYPAYERMLASGITNICIHKGLLPADYKNEFPTWEHARVDDVGKAARDWPQLNFIIYHSAFRPFLTTPDPLVQQFDETGRIDWVSDLADIPEQFGVSNVYAELGTTFGSCAVTHPKLAAALMGVLVRGMGADHVIWGTDSVWYGSPQWQIEAMRRMEIPEDMRKAHNFAALGEAEGEVKTAIFSGNATRLYGLESLAAPDAAWRSDRLTEIKAEYVAAGGAPSNAFYGFIAEAGGHV
ncbi:MAG: amidohydrolase family protein [Alphaproteobacteria bacterium]|nr:amidohydrolase family protein [Alphaproteobacteria bacterium]